MGGSLSDPGRGRRKNTGTPQSGKSMRQKRAKFPSSLRDLPRPQPASVFRVEGRGTRGLGEAPAVPSPRKWLHFRGLIRDPSQTGTVLWGHLADERCPTTSAHLQLKSTAPRPLVSIHACTHAPPARTRPPHARAERPLLQVLEHMWAGKGLLVTGHEDWGGG